MVQAHTWGNNLGTWPRCPARHASEVGAPGSDGVGKFLTSEWHAGGNLSCTWASHGLVSSDDKGHSAAGFLGPA